MLLIFSFQNLHILDQAKRHKGTIYDQQSPKYLPKYCVRELCTLLGHVFKKSHISTSHIQKKTPNPNIIFKISVYSTKYTNDTKILSKTPFFKQIKKTITSFYFIIMYIYIYNFHNSYSVKFVYFIFLRIFVYFIHFV